MNSFAKIIEGKRFKKVTYYSIQFEDEAESLFLKFLNKHTDEKYTDSINLIRSWLARLGDDIGARNQYFRHEKAAHGLPPPAFIIKVDCALRLYCLRINDHAVILFDGGEKTAPTAQECDICRPLFNQANLLTQAIDKIINKEITTDPKTGELFFDEDLILEI